VRNRRTLDEADEAARAAVGEIYRRSAARFWLPTFFLDRERRDAMRGLIAFFVIATDAIAKAPTSDCCSSDGGGGVTGLLGMRIESLCSQSIQLPPIEERDPYLHVLHAMSRAVQRFQIPQSYLLDWLEGMQRDRATLRYATWSALQRHFHAVHGSMALAATAILGVTRSDARESILHLASAAALSDALLRIREDANAGRIYLPLEDLAAHRHSERDLLAGIANESFESVIQFERQRAIQLLDCGASIVPWLGSDGARIAASLAIARIRGQLLASQSGSVGVFKHAWRLMRQRRETAPAVPSSPASTTPTR